MCIRDSSTSGAKDSRLENIFQEACANASPKICGLLQEVSALGHYPKRYKQPQNKEERDSNSLAKKLTQARSSLHPAVEKYLEAMKATLEALQAESIATERAKQAEGLMQQVRALGRMPKRNHDPKEDHLAHDLRRARAAGFMTSYESELR